jgi:hypothetical protein
MSNLEAVGEVLDRSDAVREHLDAAMKQLAAGAFGLTDTQTDDVLHTAYAFVAAYAVAHSDAPEVLMLMLNDGARKVLHKVFFGGVGTALLLSGAQAKQFMADLKALDEMRSADAEVVGDDDGGEAPIQ